MLDTFSGSFIEAREGTEELFIGSQLFRGRAPDPFDLGMPEARFDGACDSFRNPILKLEDLLHFAVVLVGPDLHSSLCLDQPTCNAQAIAEPSDTTVQQVADA